MITSGIKNIYREINQNKKIAFELAKQNFKNKYLGSYLGVIWAFIQPTVMIAIYWFIFQVGFRTLPVDDYPFLLWFMAGIIPWFYFSEALSSATNSIIDNSHLVKKVVFPVYTLPFMSIISALFVHIFFLFVLIILFILFGFGIDIYYIQIPFYLLAMILLITALAYITSSIIVFFKDIGQIIAMILQFGFWLTPILWHIDMLPTKYELWIKLNPIYYIVEGYRDIFIYKMWFWEKPFLSLSYFSTVFVLLLIGIFIFKKLKPHFSDVI